MKIENFLLLLCVSTVFFQPYLRNSGCAPASQALLSRQMTVVPRFEPGECAFPTPDPEKDKVRCGYLVVPENRTRSNSRPIRLPVIIQKSNSATPAPDPILRTLGGPGASSLKIVRGRRSSPWLDRRDVVIFEQRGTALAQPSLDCPEVDAANLASNRANLDRKAATQREVAAAKVCHDRLVNSGVDLSGYNSAESAADIEDLRRVLGYEQWNLYGVSYSARLMLEVMRDHPAGVRSVAIESVLPPSVNYDEVGVDGAVRALKVVFTTCAAQADCARAYPNLEQTFYDVVRKANQKPIAFKVKPRDGAASLTVTLNGHDVTDWVLDYLLSNDAESVADAPWQIFRFHRGDFRALQRYAESKVNDRGFYSLGMRYSVWCREEFPFENAKKIRAQSDRYEGLPGYSIQNYFPGVCAVWKVPAAKPIENQPVKSDIPTLLLGAEYDAYTPPDWGRLAAQTLSRSYFFEIPGVGHGPGFSSQCARTLVAAFFDDPTRAPDSNCVKTPGPRFTLGK
ncbi:MAG: alpha/beta hydrolase [Pyrinomonadaceae bacterium]